MLISLTLAPLIKTHLKSEFLPILLRVNAYQFCIPFFCRTKSNQSRRLSSIGFGNSQKSSSSIMFDCRTNRTPIERLGLIGFDWFLVRFRSIDYACRIVQMMWSRSVDYQSLRVLSIMPKIPEISVGIQMERSVSVSSDRNIRDHLWRSSTYFGRNSDRNLPFHF